MNRITDIELIKAGETVLKIHSKAPASEVLILSVEIISENYAWVKWTLTKNAHFLYTTDFRKSDGIADCGMWHDLTTQMWPRTTVL
jgi:hypothetical protein